MLLILSLYAQSSLGSFRQMFEEMDKMMENFEQSINIVGDMDSFNIGGGIENSEDSEFVTYEIKDRGGDTDIDITNDYRLSIKQSSGEANSMSSMNYSTSLPRYVDLNDYKVDKMGDKITIKFRKKPAAPSGNII